MKTFAILPALVLYLNVAVAQQKSNASGFDNLVSQHYRENEPGAAILIAFDDQVIYTKSSGLANIELNVPLQIDHVFKIGSITKQFTAVAILQLMEQGKLNLDDDINKFIPGYPTQGNKITLEHLLTHTSGIKSFTSMNDYSERMTLDVTPAELIDHFKNQPLIFQPGTKYEYSNSNYILLGYIIETLTGTTYSEYLNNQFFKPLKMSNSYSLRDQEIIINRVNGYDKPDNHFINARPLSMTQPYAAGSIQSTVKDLFKWHQALHSYKLIKEETLEKALANHVLPGGIQTNYGYGWQMGMVRESASFEHGGRINGFLSMQIYLPAEKIFVSVLSNCTCNPPDELAAKLAALAMGKPYDMKLIAGVNASLHGYEGVYENHLGEKRTITVEKNHLYSQRGNSPEFTLFPYEKDKFTIPGALLTMEFIRNKNGVIENLITYNREGKIVWKYTSSKAIVNEIIPDPVMLDKYTGTYEMSPQFIFEVNREGNKLFVQATGQEKFELGAASQTRFFSKVDDAQFEFIIDEEKKISKVLLTQGGRQAEARKTK